MVERIKVERRTPFGDNPVVGARGTQTQQRILRAALEVFAEHGYPDSKVEQISRAAGCSRPTFYQYFSSKEDVFRSLARYVGRSMVEMTERLGPVTADAAGRAAVTAWTAEVAEFYDEHAPVFTAFSAATRADAALARGSKAVSAGFGKALRPNLSLPPGATDQGVLASLTITMVLRANLLRQGGAGAVGRQRFLDGLSGIVHRVLVGPVEGLDAPAAPGGPPTDQRPRHRDGSAPPRHNGSRALSAQGEAMRRRLIDAGIEVFPRRSYHDTRVDDVVAAAGASHGSFYRYFDSKADLFRTIADEAAEPMVACLDAFPDAAPSRNGRGDDLRTWLNGWFRVYADHGTVIALWRETQLPDPVLDEVTGRVADAALASIHRALADGGVGDPLVGAMAFVGLMETVPHHVQVLRYFPRATAIDALVALIRRGFFGAPA